MATKKQYTLADVEAAVGSTSSASGTANTTRTATSDNTQRTGKKTYTMDDIEKGLADTAANIKGSEGAKFISGNASSPASQRALMNAAEKSGDTEKVQALWKQQQQAAIESRKNRTAQQKAEAAQALSGSKYPAIKTETEEEQQTAQNPLLRQAAPTGTVSAAQQRIENKNSDYDQKLAAGEADDEAVARLIAMESYANDSWADRQARNVRSNQSTGGDYNTNVTNEKLYQYYNEWLDETDETGAQKNRQLAKAVRRVDGSNGMYTDEDLRRELGVTQEQIDIARTYNNAYDTMTPLYSLLRRAAEDVGGTYDTVLGSGAMALGNAKTALEDTKANLTNTDWLTRNAARMALEETPEDQRDEAWAQQLTAAQSAVDEVTQATASRNGVTQYGNDLYKEGNALLSDAQLGQTAAQKFVHGAAVSAGENLAVGAINPALILPVLSLQGAGDSLAESYESGEDAGTALVRGGAKFAAGWAINSVGVTQLAETMGSEYAASELAKQIANIWKKPEVMAKLAESAPAIYAAITGGADNAVQAFAETYADKIIDNAVDGKDLTDGITVDTFKQAVQSGASGGLAGAMGGFVGSGVGAARQKAYEQAVQEAQGAEQAEAATDRNVGTSSTAQEAQRAALTGQTTQTERTTPQTEQAAQSAEQGAQNVDNDINKNVDNLNKNIDDIESEQAAGQSDRTEINTEDTARAKTETENRTRANEGAEAETQQAAQAAEEHAQKEGQTINEEAAEAQTVTESGQKNEQETPAETKAEARQLDTSAWDAQQKQSAAQMLEAGRVSTAAVQTIVDAMPAGINAETYTTAARSVYRLARTGIASNFEDVISQTRNISGVNAAQVMAVPGGENALRQAFVVGQGELKANGRERANYQAPVLAQKSRAGQMLNKSSTRTEAEKAFIDLTAKASDIGITLEEHLKNNAMGYIEDVEIHVGDKGGAVSTTLHEALHYADSWSAETAQNLNDVTLRALAEKNGFETVERMIEAKIETYAQAGTELTWADAANELVNDAVSGAFDSEESMRELAGVMAKEAEKNAERRGAMQKVADSIRAVLDKVIEKAREILNGDRSNAAARKVMALAEAQKKAIREAFYEHLEQAGENRRAAENKNARAEEGTGEVKYQEREYPQAGMSGEEQVSYDTLVNLPDMKITRIANSVPAGTDFHAVIADAMENMGATRDSTQTTVTNQYTGMEIVVHKKGLLHSMHMDRQLARNGPYVQQIGSILENAVKVNELESRGKEYRSDLYLGAAQNENGELVGVRLNVQVYKNGEAVLDGENIELLRGNLYSHTGTKIGTTAPMSVRTGHAASSAPSHSSYLSVADFLQAVKEKLGGVVSEDVKENIQSTAETPREFENSLRYQLDDETEADWNSYTARTAAMSMTGADAGEALGQAVSEATETAAKTEAATNRNVADTLARRLIRMTASKATQADIAPRFEAILNYITQSAANGTEIDGSELVTALEDVSEAAMRDASTLNTDLWDQHKDLQSYSLWISKDSDAYPTLVREYGSWTKAQKELAKQGIYARNTKTGKDGSVYLSISQMYQQLSNPKDGYPGMFSPEIVSESDQLERMIEVRNGIRPTLENQFDETWDESRLDFALQMAQDMLTSPAFGGTEEAAQTRKALATQIETLRANAVERTLENAESIRRRDQGDWEKQFAAQKNRDAATRTRTRESYQRQFQEQAAKNQGQLKRAREARENDNLRRGIARDTAALNKMLLHPAKDKYVPQALIKSVAEVAEIANGLTNNQKAKEKLSALRNEIDRNGTGDTSTGGIASDWQQSGVSQMILNLQESMNETRDAELRKLKSRLENLNKAKETEANAQRREVLQRRIAELESPTGMARMTNTQLAQLRDIVAATVTTVRNADRLISKAKTQEAGAYAEKVEQEVRTSKGPDENETIGGAVSRAKNSYLTDMEQAERFFNRVGGWAEEGMTTGIAEMLNEGQHKQQLIMMKGEELFGKVFNEDRAKEMRDYQKKKVDIGLKDLKTGESVKINHDMLVSLYMGLHDEQNANHMLQGGIKVPNMKLYEKGEIKRAYQLGNRCGIGMLTEGSTDLTAAKQQIIEAVEAALTDYDREVIAVEQEFYSKFTKGYINETSMKMLGFNRAENPNYYPIVSDPDVIVKAIEGVKRDSTIEGKGFLKDRQNRASTPILLEGASKVALRSLEDVAAYSGLAAPIRDAQKILNSRTEDGITLKAAIKEKYGDKAMEYIDNLLSDLQYKPTSRQNVLSKGIKAATGRAVSSVLNANPSVALAQVASLPTAMAELGGGATLASTGQFVRDLNPLSDQREIIEQEMREHGSTMLYTRTADSARYTLSTMNKIEGPLAKAQRNHTWVATVTGSNWIGTMDKLTVMSLWTGAKTYVKNHAGEFGSGAEVVGSDEYWDAVNVKFAQTVERTQPNYTVMQQPAISRDPDRMTKALIQYTTQRFQNFGILADAIGDCVAQYDHGSKESRERAGKKLGRAVASQALQIAMFSVVKVGFDFALHRVDDERDENGDLSWEKTLIKYGKLCFSTLLGGSLGGSEVFTMLDNFVNGTDYDVVSVSALGTINDFIAAGTSYVKLLGKSTSDMSEAELETYHDQLASKLQKLLRMGGAAVVGLPVDNYYKIYSSARTFVQDTVAGDPLLTYKTSGTITASTQYDRAYNAIFNTESGEVDAEEMQGALGKLNELQQQAIEKVEARTDISDAAKRQKVAALQADDAVESDILAQIKTRMTKAGYNENVKKTIDDAANALLDGDSDKAMELVQPIKDKLYTALGIDPSANADAKRREAVADTVNGAVNSVRDTLLKDGASSVYTTMLDTLENEGTAAAQKEIDKLVTAGKTDSAIKNALSGAYKQEYIDGTDAEREEIIDLLTELQNSQGKAYYTVKEIRKWGK